jgi:CheY-like chemotaxis protein/two-component sensor histidine kinase
MSHEIRTPMNAILGFSNMLKRNNLSNEKKQKYLDFIESGGKRLLRIISDIVDLSKMDTNHLTLSYEICNLNKLITKLQEQFNLNNKNGTQNIIVNNGLSDANSYIITDQTRLEQILSNLIENAVKYAPNGNIKVGYKKEGQRLVFYVKDEGNGIEKKDHKSIFGRFQQVENEYSGTNTSTGLGLSIVKELTELMKGEVWVESKEGSGATFYFTIPYQKANRRMSYIDSKTIKIKVDRKEVILVAEDEIINFLYLEALFERYPFKILHAKNGKEAVTMIEENEAISLVLMDIKMPIMNGIEATMEIRKKNKNLPIIALTAYVMEEDKEKMFCAEFNDYLAKPLDEKTLINMVKKHQKESI